MGPSIGASSSTTCWPGTSIGSPGCTGSWRPRCSRRWPTSTARRCRRWPASTRPPSTRRTGHASAYKQASNAAAGSHWSHGSAVSRYEGRRMRPSPTAHRPRESSAARSWSLGCWRIGARSTPTRTVSRYTTSDGSPTSTFPDHYGPRGQTRWHDGDARPWWSAGRVMTPSMRGSHPRCSRSHHRRAACGGGCACAVRAGGRRRRTRTAGTSPTAHQHPALLPVYRDIEELLAERGRDGVVGQLPQQPRHLHPGEQEGRRSPRPVLCRVVPHRTHLSTAPPAGSIPSAPGGCSLSARVTRGWGGTRCSRDEAGMKAAHATLRLTFVGAGLRTFPPDVLDTVVARLAAAWAELTSGPRTGSRADVDR